MFKPNAGKDCYLRSGDNGDWNSTTARTVAVHLDGIDTVPHRLREAMPSVPTSHNSAAVCHPKYTPLPLYVVGGSAAPIHGCDARHDARFHTMPNVEGGAIHREDRGNGDDELFETGIHLRAGVRSAIPLGNVSGDHPGMIVWLHGDASSHPEAGHPLTIPVTVNVESLQTTTLAVTNGTIERHRGGNVRSGCQHLLAVS